MDRYTRDEMLDHAQDFDDLAPNRSEQERASIPSALHKRPGGVSATPLSSPGRNSFKDRDPKLRKAAVIAALNLACKHTREDEGDMALIQVDVAARLLRGER